MDAISKTNETIYKFRFGNSKKTIQITQQQLNHFPYLFALVNHTDDFSVNTNDDGEYILKYPICYNWFMSIFQSVIKQQPSALFTELSHEANVLRVLELYDYLCIDPLPLLLLKNKTLVLTNPIDIDDTNQHIEWRQANICEARNIAIQFIIGISKNVYNLNDFETRNSVFILLMNIFTHPNIFHSRFRYHTLQIVKKYCFSLFSSSQQRQLPSTQQIIQNMNIDFVRYLDNENQSLPPNFNNSFAWKGIYVSKDEADADLQPMHGIYRSENDIHSAYLPWINFHWGENESDWERRSHFNPITISLGRSAYSLGVLQYADYSRALHNVNRSFGHFRSFQYNPQQEQERKKNEAASARSGRFNTLPKRPKFDKFKH
ncbi:unnamed protein product [Adineta steineri]|uniref:Uncharacterized protein n=1 Tax=Adineta steineri TaxID=433720 RepID=A0A814QVV3_9BILA|nr:unnamed protein product [Adineta steineri]CAF1405590.1 unnamed protein product [Adineta steineri]CAF1439725.1 unnamed protein product [Adineta steineri]CAF3864309.1 unnamed protein product [Adineta steineri]CAF3979785.1 unnamed protein product [Adineta steineri]